MNLAFSNRLNVVFSKLLQSLSTISQAALLKLRKKLKLPKISTRSVISYLVVLVTVILFIVVAKLYITNPDQFQLNAPFLISCAATICALMSACLALWSLEATEKALELTRITVRPFLALQPGEVPSKRSQHIVTLVFHVKNTGPVPADLITAEIAFFDEAEVIEYDNKSKHYPTELKRPEGVVIFPGAVYNFEQAVNSSHSSGKKLLNGMLNGKVKLRFRVTYGAQGMEYVTVQTERLEKEVAGEVRRVPIQPHRWT